MGVRYARAMSQLTGPIDLSALPLKSVLEGPSPQLVVFAERVRDNIRRVRDICAGFFPGTGFETFRPHVKTHKSEAVARRQLQRQHRFADWREAPDCALRQFCAFLRNRTAAGGGR